MSLQSPATSPAAPRSSKTPEAPRREESGVKETIESILVAFILAFIFRAFIVEAFVIPTGSMAPTLLGAHMRFRCEDCGYRFTVNVSGKSDGDDLKIDSVARGRHTAICSNCGYNVPQVNPDDPANAATDAKVHYGDRILVLKYLYLFQEPQRWDVVVFKSPDTPPQGAEWYETNYIKRLVGKPGESILLLDGDVYKSPGSLKLDDYEVQAKPRHVQEALWRVIYDNDYRPRGFTRMNGEKWQQPWTLIDGAGWDLSGEQTHGRIFHFDNPAGAATLNFNDQANVDEHGFTNWLAYDAEAYRSGIATAPNTISGDLKLSMFYIREEGEGALRLKLTKYEDEFIAEVTPDAVKLLHNTPTSQQQIGEAPLPASARPLRIEFTNVDYQVTLRINGRQLIQTTPRQYQPDKRRLLMNHKTNSFAPRPRVEITASDQKCAISHVGLWRDTEYLVDPRRLDHGASPLNFPENVVHLGEKEYFVLGDNSAMSGDARFWNKPINLDAEDLHVPAGRVPERFLLGKAFFVYWPAGYPPFTGAPAVTPNFGEMRFIH